MSKNCRFTALCNKQHDKRAQTLFKSDRRQFYHIYLLQITYLLQRQLSLKKSLLVIREILRLFVNTFTPNDKYSFLNREYLTQRIHMYLSKLQKHTSEIFSPFLKSRLNFEHIQEKMIPIANAFPKLQAFKNVVR